MSAFVDELEKLARLQELDSEILSLRGELDGYAGRVAEWKSAAGKVGGELEKVRAEHTRVKLQHREGEVELEAYEEHIKKLQKMLNEVKTNKEYAAVQSEIAGLRKKISECEEEILLSMDRDDELAGREHELSRLHEEEQKNLALRIAAEDARMEEVRRLLAEKESARRAFVAEIDPEMYAEYERVRRSTRDGIAICLLSEEAGKEVCSGCFVCVPAYIAEKVHAKKELVHCENCSRILR